jgi:hypothetical protein
VKPVFDHVIQRFSDSYIPEDPWMRAFYYGSLDGKCTSQRIIQTLQSEDTICVENALVYREGHRTKE